MTWAIWQLEDHEEHPLRRKVRAPNIWHTYVGLESIPVYGNNLRVVITSRRTTWRFAMKRNYPYYMKYVSLQNFKKQTNISYIPSSLASWGKNRHASICFIAYSTVLIISTKNTFHDRRFSVPFTYFRVLNQSYITFLGLCLAKCLPNIMEISLAEIWIWMW